MSSDGESTAAPGAVIDKPLVGEYGKVHSNPVGQEDEVDRSTWDKTRIRMSELVDTIAEIRHQAMSATQKLKGPPDKSGAVEREANSDPDSSNFQEALTIDLGRAEKYLMEIREYLKHLAE